MQAVCDKHATETCRLYVTNTLLKHAGCMWQTRYWNMQTVCDRQLLKPVAVRDRHATETCRQCVTNTLLKHADCMWQTRYWNMWAVYDRQATETCGCMWQTRYWNMQVVCDRHATETCRLYVTKTLLKHVAVCDRHATETCGSMWQTRYWNMWLYVTNTLLKHAGCYSNMWLYVTDTLLKQVALCDKHGTETGGCMWQTRYWNMLLYVTDTLLKQVAVCDKHATETGGCMWRTRYWNMQAFTQTCGCMWQKPQWTVPSGGTTWPSRCLTSSSTRRPYCSSTEAATIMGEMTARLHGTRSRKEGQRWSKCFHGSYKLCSPKFTNFSQTFKNIFFQIQGPNSMGNTGLLNFPHVLHI